MWFGIAWLLEHLLDAGEMENHEQVSVDKTTDYRLHNIIFTLYDWTGLAAFAYLYWVRLSWIIYRYSVVEESQGRKLERRESLVYDKTETGE
jgi:hypothetical protein